MPSVGTRYRKRDEGAVPPVGTRYREREMRERCPLWALIVPRHSSPLSSKLPLFSSLLPASTNPLACVFFQKQKKNQMFRNSGCSFGLIRLARRRTAPRKHTQKRACGVDVGEGVPSMACSRRVRCFVARRGRRPRPLRSRAQTSFACACVPTPIWPRSHQPADRTSRGAGSRATCHACRRLCARASCRLWPRARARFALCHAVECLREL